MSLIQEKIIEYLTPKTLFENGGLKITIAPNLEGVYIYIIIDSIKTKEFYYNYANKTLTY